MTELDRNRVLVGMSGGVDSSAAVCLPRGAGFQVLGATLRLVAGAGDMPDKLRAVAALTRRGHSYASIREGLRQLSLETDELPEDE